MEKREQSILIVVCVATFLLLVFAYRHLFQTTEDIFPGGQTHDFHVQGVVLGFDGQALPNAAVEYESVIQPVDQQGRFQIGIRTTQPVRLVVRAPEYLDETLSIERNGEEEQRIVLRPVRGLQAQLTRRDGTPISGAQIFLRQKIGNNQGHQAQLVTDSLGRAQMAPVPLGDYGVEVFLGDQKVLEQTVQVQPEGWTEFASTLD